MPKAKEAEVEAFRPFAARLRKAREERRTELGALISKAEAARIYNVSSDTYHNWEAARRLPDARSRQRILELWPEVFNY